jgi:hypothetical protein
MAARSRRTDCTGVKAAETAIEQTLWRLPGQTGASFATVRLRLFPRNSPKMNKADAVHHQVIEIIGAP